MTELQIIQAYVSGETSEDIALRAGCSSTTVLQIVRDAGETIRAPGKRQRKKLPLTDAEIVRRYREGESGTALANAAGTTTATIYKVLRSAGQPIRPPTSIKARQRFKPPSAKGGADGR